MGNASGRIKAVVQKRRRAVFSAPPPDVNAGFAHHVEGVVLGQPLNVAVEGAFVPFTGEVIPDEQLTQHVRDYPVGPTVFAGLAMDMTHLGQGIVQAYNQPDLAEELANVDSNELLKYLGEKDHDWEQHLQHGVSYSGHQQYHSVDMLTPPLMALIQYAETNPLAAPDIKPKLRFITKSLRGDANGFQEERLGVLPLLATHGSVCNVMKETGIRATYAALADCVKSENDVADVRNKVLQLLYDYRELRIEHLYVAHAQNGNTDVNTHNVVGYRNAIGPFVGLSRIPDPDMGDNASAVQMVPAFFARFYHVGTVLNVVLAALNDPPRRLNYEATVSFLQYNRPSSFSDAEDFLYHCFDDDGKFTRGAAAWLLHKSGVLRVADGVSSADMKELFPPLSELSLSRSRDAVMLRSGDHEATEQLTVSMKEELDDLITSSEYAVQHVCDNCAHHKNFY